MKIHTCSDYAQLSKLCSDSIISELSANREKLICVATGNSPRGVYQNLTDHCTTSPDLFKKLSIVKLDEWGGIPSTDLNSCESFIRKNILRPLTVAEERYIAFKSNPAAPQKECDRIQNEIERRGPLDICILGLGKNGHIGLNEPADILIPHCHVAQLSKTSLEHQMADGMKVKPSYGLTLGMTDILQSKKIKLLITGSNKEKIISKLLSRQISTRLPASFLWVHPNVDCYIDSSSI